MKEWANIQLTYNWPPDFSANLEVKFINPKSISAMQRENQRDEH